MPRRDDLKKILVIGSGPIVIGQACEFDYSGTQGVRALREEGYEVVLVNSNPATIMTDPELAERTYVEPLTVEILTRVIEKEKPCALLPTLGGQTALNLALALDEAGVLKKHGVQMLGASRHAIEMAEDRELFKLAMARIGLAVPKSGYATNMAEARAIVAETGYPAIIRASFTLGGAGASIAYSAEEFEEKAAWGIACSPRSQILIDESVLGWKEYELEVMRDKKDNVVVICSIENVDPMGVHTGDSITVAPAMTLTDREYQRMRDAAVAVLREIGVETGGSNVQFALDPKTGRMVVVEMNPRVSRSSALASKATGFPIAKIAAKLAVGYTLDEIPNDITRDRSRKHDVNADAGSFQPASFEPTIDYVVVKAPRFAFEKFPGTDTTLTTQMKSVGEVMAIGRTFKEALGKALRGLEIGRSGFDQPTSGELLGRLAVPTADRLFLVAEALRQGATIDQVFDRSKIDPWFLTEVAAVVALEEEARCSLDAIDADAMWRYKSAGLSDRRLAALTSSTEQAVRVARKALGVVATYRRVDTCGAEFVALTPYLYSTYERPVRRAGVMLSSCEARPTERKKAIILGGGPNRIGQGIEFDYCCVHAVQALREEGWETLMVNCNPETVSTDYDTADRLYFESLTVEDVLNILDVEVPGWESGNGTEYGVIVQFGGQTPLRLAVPLGDAGVKLLGTSADAIDRAEDRERFGEVLEKAGATAPPFGTALNLAEAHAVIERIGLPAMVRPSYVLGGRAMEIVDDLAQLDGFVTAAFAAQGGDGRGHAQPVLLDRFLADAIEVDVDLLCDGKNVLVGAVMEHIEEASIHSGDSACALPPFSLTPKVIAAIEAQVGKMALELGVIGLMNAQLAVQGDAIYVLEVNPRASRTVPFVSKVTGQPLARYAAKLMVGRTIASLGIERVVPAYVGVKESVFPFVKFPGADVLLGPEMRSTGEVMGIDRDFPIAFAKSQLGAGTRMPATGVAFLAVRDADKPGIVEVARQLHATGLSLLATNGTAKVLRDAGLPCPTINKMREGSPHCVEAIDRGDIALVINTVGDRADRIDSFSLRRTALQRGVPYFTTLRAARAAALGLAALKAGALDVRPLQDYHHPFEV
ncbi:MAG: carbamoyl-phosphate synthase large subunit [Polyangia bacterium]